jgi:hypothetical protein
MFRESRLVRIVLGLFFLLLAGYALFEARGILIGPMITVPEEAVTVSEPLTHIRGRAERITELRLNGKQIPVTESGEFDEPFLLAEGSNHLILEAKDQRGRTTEARLIIVYRPAPHAGNSE